MVVLTGSNGEMQGRATPRSIAPPAKLLWTGGWDSTFRLLHCLLDEGRPVEPHYVLDAGRQSIPHELAAMGRIRRAVAQRGDLPPILPTRYFAKHELADDPEVTAWLAGARQSLHLGSQYSWLVRLARQHGLDGLELAVHRDDQLHRLISAEVVRDETGAWRVRHDASPLCSPLRAFSFPIFEQTKPDMAAWAAARGLTAIMELTWFCHSPRAGRPCGICQPCRYAVAEGMGHRLPRSSRLLMRVVGAMLWVKRRFRRG